MCRGYSPRTKCDICTVHFCRILFLNNDVTTENTQHISILKRFTQDKISQLDFDHFWRCAARRLVDDIPIVFVFVISRPQLQLWSDYDFSKLHFPCRMPKRCFAAPQIPERIWRRQNWQWDEINPRSYRLEHIDFCNIIYYLLIIFMNTSKNVYFPSQGWVLFFFSVDFRL